MEAFSYIVYGLHPIVLVGSHMKFLENITRLPNLQHLDAGSIDNINLQKSAFLLKPYGVIAQQTCLIIYINPIKTKKRLLTLCIIAFSSSALNVDRNAAFASGSSRRTTSPSVLDISTLILDLVWAAASGLITWGSDAILNFQLNSQ